MWAEHHRSSLLLGGGRLSSELPLQIEPVSMSFRGGTVSSPPPHAVRLSLSSAKRRGQISEATHRDALFWPPLPDFRRRELQSWIFGAQICEHTQGVTRPCVCKCDSLLGSASPNTAANAAAPPQPSSLVSPSTTAITARVVSTHPARKYRAFCHQIVASLFSPATTAASSPAARYHQ